MVARRALSFFWRPAAVLATAAALGGCAAASVAVAERELDVQTRMTDAIFLDPGAGERTVYVEVRNGTDKPELDVAGPVRANVAAKGYRVVDDPAAARYLLHANVLQAGRSARTAARAAPYGKGRDGAGGSAVAGGVLGGAAGYGAGRLGGGGDAALAIGGALAGAAVATLADAYVQSVEYTLVTDVQVSERAPSGLVVTEMQRAGLPQGSGGTVSQSSGRTSAWRRYRTRIVSTAGRANLAWHEAAPSLAAGLARSIAGIF